MEVSESIETRRSIRKYKKDIPSDGLIMQCVEAACFAPSANNSQPWKFAVVKEREKIGALSETNKPYSAFLFNAPVVIVALADALQSPNHWIEDVSCAIMILMLKANSLGLGTCWNAVYSPKNQKREEYVREVLGISSKYRVLANIGVGFPDEKPEKKEVKSFDESTLSCEAHGTTARL